MAIKQTESASDTSLCTATPTRRSTRLNPASSDLKTVTPINKPEKSLQTNESSAVKKQKKKKKLFQGFQPKKKSSKKRKLNSSTSDSECYHIETAKRPSKKRKLNPSVSDSECAKDELRNPCLRSCESEIEDPAELALVREKIEHEPKQPIQLQSPKKTRVIADKPVHDKPALSESQKFNPFDPDHIQAVKAALHLSTMPDSMICRDAEQKKVFDFCKERLIEQKPGSLYVCGCPGTGKSLLMEKVKLMSSKWTKESGLDAPEIVGFNCTSLTNPADIFERILQNLSPDTKRKPQKTCKFPGLKEVKQALRKPTHSTSGRMLMMIIDELDYLLGKDQTVLHELFELPSQSNSRCILIGISNSIDLADRLLPSFSSLSFHPTVIPFSPYTKDQVVSVINQRTKDLPFAVFHPAALELCARKVAAATGDMRKALHVCRIAFELLELEVQSECSVKESNQESENNLSTTRVYMVQIHHMAQALTRTFRSAAVDIVKSLPKHQQMVLCSAVRLFRQKKKDTTLGQLNIGYVEFCKSTGIPALSVPEFSCVCRVLADQGLLNVGTSKEERLRRVTLQVDEDDIVFALQSIRFFSNVLT